MALKKRAILLALNNTGYYSLAIHYLRLYAEKDPALSSKCRIYCAEYDLQTENASIIENIYKLQPDLIGFSCYLWNIEKVLAIARQTKRALPKTKIVLGGQEMTNSSIDYLKTAKAIDIVVGGAGETTFKNILWRMVDDDFKALDTVDNIRYRDRHGIHVTPLVHDEIDLGDLPSPYLCGAVSLPADNKLGVMIEHIRGCPKQCSFCFEAARHEKSKAFPLERVEEELRWAKSKGIDKFHILDPILCNNNPRLLQKMNATFTRVFNRMQTSVSVEVYAEHISESTIDYYDCFHIFDIGLQTISGAANRAINRRLNLGKFIAGVELLQKLQRYTNIYLIYGLPGDTYDSFMHGICFRRVVATDDYISKQIMRPKRNRASP